ncbi:MAG: rod shape-determining protein MreC [Flammeovirgaceae bacterium]|nr:rod shape-determining protein MreC [Flammeovirgaceae bacterium]MDW8286506.1 rod shape-determining protein MreC [Flammeovirgaceae bacterium]
MRQIFLFIFRHRVFFVFLLLETIALFLVYTNNIYQKIAFLNSANAVAGSIYEGKSKITRYISLKNVNEELMKENVQLRTLLNEYEKMLVVQKTPLIGEATYQYIPAYVINNSFHQLENYLTIDKGTADGIRPGMGIISARGVVGQIKSCSEHFSTAYSLLHGDINVSCVVKKTRTLCTTNWTTTDPTKANLLFIPQHVPLAKGDTIVTSGFNSVFPEGILVGTVADVSPHGKNNFKKVIIDLSVDFTSLSYVYVVKNKNAYEKDSLEKATLIPTVVKPTK